MRADPAVGDERPIASNLKIDLVFFLSAVL